MIEPPFETLETPSRAQGKVGASSTTLLSSGQMVHPAPSPSEQRGHPAHVALSP
jgi:hypothetical protein